MTGKLDGRVALVTGGAGGIGSATARLMAEEGAAVVVADLREDDAAKVAAELGAPAISVALDVTRKEAWQAAASAIDAAFGRLDVLFNNAG